MKQMRIRFALLLIVLPVLAAADKAQRTPKEALQSFNELIGSWRATGMPEGTQAEKRKGFWTETIAWDWQFKGDDAWLNIAFDKGKYFDKGTLRYLPDKDIYQLNLKTTDKDSLIFEGRLENRILTLEREDRNKKEAQRLVITMLHETRFLYRYEVKAPERTGFARLYQVGGTKEGIPFAGPGDSRPECIVSGGLGTSKLTYKGKDYYFCCSGCRDAFKDDPEKFIKDYEAKKKPTK